jgi:predicted metal-binding membrane protein
MIATPMLNMGAMALITALIFAEKALPAGHRLGLLAGVVLVGYGLLVMLMPGVLPTMM